MNNRTTNVTKLYTCDYCGRHDWAGFVRLSDWDLWLCRPSRLVPNAPDCYMLVHLLNARQIEQLLTGQEL